MGRQLLFLILQGRLTLLQTLFLVRQGRLLGGHRGGLNAQGGALLVRREGSDQVDGKLEGADGQQVGLGQGPRRNRLTVDQGAGATEVADDQAGGAKGQGAVQVGDAFGVEAQVAARSAAQDR